MKRFLTPMVLMLGLGLLFSHSACTYHTEVSPISATGVPALTMTPTLIGGFTVTSTPTATVTSTPSGASWQYVGSSDFSAGSALYLSGSAYSPSGEPVVAYADGANSNKNNVEIYNGASWVNYGNADFSAGGTAYNELYIDPNSGNNYVAYQDQAYGNKATVYKMSSTPSTWSPVGSVGFTSNSAYCLALITYLDTPYVAYSDNDFKATVMTYSAGSWSVVGNAQFSAGMIFSTSLAVNPSNGTLYVAFSDEGNSGQATVFTFNGTTWVNLGITGLATGDSPNISLAYNNGLYLAYTSGSNEVTVAEYNGTSWVNVGSADFSVVGVDGLSLSFNGSTPYVGFSDANNNDPTVMKYNGASWVNVGSTDFSTNSGGGYISLFFSGSTPYIAFHDNYSNNYKTSVMAYK